MRILLGFLLVVNLSASRVCGEQVRMQVEWGFGPKPCERYGDGQVCVLDGELVSVQAVSFEADRHDLLKPPTVQSFTMNKGTDGMELIVDGHDRTTVC